MKKILAVLAVAVVLTGVAFAQQDLLTNTNYPYSKVNGTYRGPITNVVAQSATVMGTNGTFSCVTNIVVQRDNGSYVNTNKYLP